jgi:enoyl-[acyl-carrier protein] reductase I
VALPLVISIFLSFHCLRTPASFQTRFVDITRSDFALALDVSAYSLIARARSLTAHERRGGCISTLSHLAAEKVIPGYQLMSVAKAALRNIIRNLAFDLAPHGVRVNGLSPGPISTKAASSHSRLR